ncbi:MAG TPA: NAD(P)/FAD-dependent oxidoreductase [Candidatus Merdenecus merdavium]|nr:NAD(P)/FAD-dependent oxidoreductase [Candidatus Merdenecus merdavium]
MSKVVIVGGGAAGMFAAIFAARNGHEVHIYEKNEKLGKKLFITGKGRCNITNGCDMEGLFDSVTSNSKFLYSAFYGYNNNDVIDFFESLGLATKIERGDRVFPVSDHSSDVIGVMKRELNRLGVKIHLSEEVKGLKTEDGFVKGVFLKGNQLETGDSVIVATGGLTYPSTGSTGDGFMFAKSVGHTISDLSPSLVPLITKEKFPRDLQGLSLRNVKVSIYHKKCLFEDFGEMMFTHYGLTGPLIISASSYITKEIKEENLSLFIDLKPALSEEKLDQRVLRDFQKNVNKQFKNSISELFPSKLIPIMIKLSGIDPDKKVNEISKEERLGFVKRIKALPLTIVGLKDYKDAIITKGGVTVKEIQPSTMESKKIKGLYFIGEVLDLDALTGGFNLQIAWSTAYAAGSNIM